MKKTFLASAAAIALLVAGPALAADFNNESKINQSGTDQLASVVQNLGSEGKSTITQTGSENIAGVNQSGESNSSKIEQSLTTNEAYVVQVGTGPAPAGANESIIDQTQSVNGLAAVNQSGDQNWSKITQIGEDNVAGVTSLGTDNRSKIVQESVPSAGSANVAYVVQGNEATDDSNDSDIKQTMTDAVWNEAYVVQNQWGSESDIIQEGYGNGLAPTEANVAYVTQDAQYTKSTVKQYGESHLASVLQTTGESASTVIQNNWNNTAYVSQ